MEAATAEPPKGAFERFNEWLHDHLDTKINENNENFQRVRAQWQMGKEVCGENVYPGRDADKAMRALASSMPGTGTLMALDDFTSPNSSDSERLSAGLQLGMSATPVIGGAAKAIS